MRPFQYRAVGNNFQLIYLIGSFFFIVITLNLVLVRVDRCGSSLADDLLSEMEISSQIRLPPKR